VATKKQRRRRKKGKRHEYEYVWVDDEGRELEIEEDALPPDVAPAKGSNGRRSAKPAAAPARGGIQPPSWRRVLKRAAIFVPLMFVAITVLPGGDELSTVGKVLLTLQWALILIPFMYLMEVVSYRVWKRRAAKPAGSGRAAKR
jgi:hypothetical protein